MKGDAWFAGAGPAGDAATRDWPRTFAAPVWSGLAHSLKEVLPLLRAALAEQERGRWLVLALAYEAAPAFDACLPVHAPTGEPLAFAAAYDAPLPAKPLTQAGPPTAAPWTPGLCREAYDRAIAAIQRHIVLGECYQVNYTFPLESRLAGDRDAWFAALAARQQAALCCRLDLGEQSLLSFSPELFFKRQGEQVTVRPMKGTLARGVTPESDAGQAAALAACPKNQAENRMITDLVRNDLGRIARPGSVVVSDRFAVEPLGAAWQMTTTVTAAVPRSLDLITVLAALFPCGSITGAPKRSAMDAIRRLEPFPRGFYTGAIGWVAPDGECLFNVAIRTVTLRHADGRCRFGVGGGITHDSRPAEEYAECRTKARFLTDPPPDFALLETLRLDNGRYSFLAEHRARLAASARTLGFPLDDRAIDAALARAEQEAAGQCRRVRLLLAACGQATTESFPLPGRLTRPARLGLCPDPVAANDPTLFHKTTRRERYDHALAARPDCDDVLLVNTRGEVTESCRATVVVRLGCRLLTPALSCGLLPGVYRARLLARGVLTEAILTPDDLARAEGLWLVNSLRLWTPAVLVRPVAALS
ncbi:chorismate-binding protein [Desulfovibrio sp. TomC]|uniref:chorismate-binding protein n=1 Tax=Desulfovibrio sp. TomC TaxID=1562888 RepID=UPI0005751E4F|nr:chorismate-binding protein [Desulfovibrio sp. TomC]KHK02100.1 Para-aminobenzoate synthase, aminase component [Desulfovibrio sp. TomC]